MNEGGTPWVLWCGAKVCGGQDMGSYTEEGSFIEQCMEEEAQGCGLEMVLLHSDFGSRIMEMLERPQKFAACALRLLSRMFRDQVMTTFTALRARPLLPGLGNRLRVDDFLRDVASSCVNLQTMDLGLSLVTDAGLLSLSRCAYLRTVKLDHCRLVTDDGIKALAEACPLLQRLLLQV